MTIFLDLRQPPSGFVVADAVSISQVAYDPASQQVSAPQAISVADLASQALGKHVVMAAHGFNVSWQDGQQSLAHWASLLQLDASWLFLGILWPGNSSWLGPLCYPGEGRNAMQSGNLLAQFIVDHLDGAASLSMVSHSLGARLVLQTVATLSQLAPGKSVRNAVLMAPAINYDCLTNEYAAAAQNIDNIALLASHEDEVLAAAFPAGNLFEGIIDSGHPWFQAALGRSGPKTMPPKKTVPAYLIPDAWRFGHGSYLEITPAVLPPLPQNLPAPADPPRPYQGHESSWSAAFVSTRLRG